MVFENREQITIPLPRLPHESAQTQTSSMSQHDEAFNYGASRLCEELLVYGNDPVYAVVGNGEAEDIQEQIVAIKGEGREARQPLGLAIGFDEFLPYIDFDQIRDKKFRRKVEDPEELTSRGGALLFVRAPARKGIAGKDVPKCVVSADGATTQTYSSIGNGRTMRFLTQARHEGVQFPVMTSANRSGVPEIIDRDEAQRFAEGAGLLFVPNPPEREAQAKPKGSYPVVEFTANAIRVVRSGFLEPKMLEALWDGYRVQIDEGTKSSNYPDHILHFTDLPPYARKARRAELRAAILAYMYGR